MNVEGVGYGLFRMVVFSRNSLGMTEKNRANYQRGLPITRPRFELMSPAPPLSKKYKSELKRYTNHTEENLCFEST
jgi:hypothetical protein